MGVILLTKMVKGIDGLSKGVGARMYVNVDHVLEIHPIPLDRLCGSVVVLQTGERLKVLQTPDQIISNIYRSDHPPVN